MRPLRKNYNGYLFSEAKKVAKRRITYPNKSELKVVYGTATNKFHFIISNDRDYNTPFSVSLYNFLRFKNNNEAKRALSGMIVHKN